MSQHINDKFKLQNLIEFVVQYNLVRQEMKTDDSKVQVILLSKVLENIQGQPETNETKIGEFAKLIQKHRHSLPFEFDLIQTESDDNNLVLQKSVSVQSQQISPIRSVRPQRNSSSKSNQNLKLTKANSLIPEETHSKTKSQKKKKQPNAIKLKDLSKSRIMQILSGNESLLQSCEQNNDELMLDQFYKKDKNYILFNVYRLVCEQTTNSKGLSYLDIMKKYNQQNGGTSSKRSCGGRPIKEKIKAQDAAHYSKKLEMCGFVRSETLKNCSEKRISLHRTKVSAERNKRFDLNFDSVMNEIQKPEKVSHQDRNQGNKDVQIEEIIKRFKFDSADSSSQYNIHMYDTLFEQKLTMRESIFRILEGKINSFNAKSETKQDSIKGNFFSDYKVKTQQNMAESKQQHFTVKDISNALCMHFEEKTLQHVMKELRDVIHKDKIQQVNVRHGKVFEYYYCLNYPGQQFEVDFPIREEEQQPNIDVPTRTSKRIQGKNPDVESNSNDPTDTLIKNVKQEIEVKSLQRTSSRANENSIEPRFDISNNIGARNLPEINDKSFERIFKIQSKKATGGVQLALLDIKSISITERQQIVLNFFKDLILHSSSDADGKKSCYQNSSSRHLTIQTIVRYVYVLNKVELKVHVSEVELRKLIKEDLEKEKNFEMDKKTLKRIIENLREVELVKTKDFPIYLFTNSSNVSDTFNKMKGEKDEDGEFIPEFDQESNFTNTPKPLIKTLVLAPDCTLSDHDLSKNPTIANPTNRLSYFEPKQAKRKPSSKPKANFLQDLSEEFYMQDSDSDKDYNSSINISVMKRVVNTRQNSSKAKKEDNGDESVISRTTSKRPQGMPTYLAQQRTQNQAIFKEIATALKETQTNELEDSLLTATVRGEKLQKYLSVWKMKDFLQRRIQANQSDAFMTFTSKFCLNTEQIQFVKDTLQMPEKNSNSMSISDFFLDTANFLSTEQSPKQTQTNLDLSGLTFDQQINTFTDSLLKQSQPTVCPKKEIKVDQEILNELWTTLKLFKSNQMLQSRKVTSDEVKKALHQLVITLGRKGVCFLCNTEYEQNFPQLGTILRTPPVLALHMTLIDILVRQGYVKIQSEDFVSSNQARRLLLSSTALFDNWFSHYIMTTKDFNLCKY